jgi:preprotein translocase subunit SecG
MKRFDPETPKSMVEVAGELNLRFLTTLYVLVCLFLLVVVLLQQGRAGDIAAAFGGSSSQTAFGARSGATLLTRATSVLAVLFLVGSLGLSIYWGKGSGSSGSSIKLPAAQTAPAAPAPTPAPPKK